MNAQLRSVLRNRRGLSTSKRVKAVFWWCCMRVECPKDMPRTLREMPTDSDIGLLRAEYGIDAEDVGAPKKWGEGIVWASLFDGVNEVPRHTFCPITRKLLLKCAYCMKKVRAEPLD